MRDIVAGCARAAINVPQLSGYARIVGMPIVTSLYRLLLPVMGFAALGSSRYLVVATRFRPPRFQEPSARLVW